MGTFLITGVAGFIASRVAEMLLQTGHSVLGLDNLNDAYDVRMKQIRLQRLLPIPNFQFYQRDIADRTILDPSTYHDRKGNPKPPDFSNLSAVFNLAARAGVRQSVENPWVYVDTNVTGTLNLLELCKDYNIPKFVLASTSSIYGADAPLPTPETANSDHPLQAYSASKKGAEALAYAYHYLNGLDVTVFRYFTVYGPWGRPDMSMFRFVQWITEGRPVKVNGDGEQSRGFTYVDDIAVGTILGLKRVGYEIINLGGHEQIKINELIRMLEKRIGKKAHVEHLPAHKADMLANWANVEKAKRLLGWGPQVSLEEGVQSLVDWYNVEREWTQGIKTG